MNRKVFFDSVRANLFAGTLTQFQVDGISAVLDEWEKRKLTDIRWLAYMLATDKWETNATMQAVREAYWLSEEWRRTHLRYYPFYGRGLVQLTWEDNYIAMGRLLSVDLMGNPDLALNLPTAVQIMFEGMIRGSFTGRKLGDYFTATLDDPLNARRIINGTDKAGEIAGIHALFLAALKAAA